MNIAMWSGPRNISTAMMRSWGNRADTVVCDEPLYAHYLAHTGLDHPGADEVIAAHESDWRAVVERLIGPVPRGSALHFQKHMAHHLLPHIDREWLGHLTHAFLIRDPREMLTSLIRRLPEPTLDDTGLPQQVEIFELRREADGKTPAVVDARDVLEHPRGTLSKLCDALEVPFSDRMLAWPPGRRDTDGVWARHWYDVVESSTCFHPYRPKTDTLPEHLEALHARCAELYRRLHPFRIRPEETGP